MIGNFPEGRMNLPGSPLEIDEGEGMCPFSHFEDNCTHCGDPMCVKKEGR